MKRRNEGESGLEKKQDKKKTPDKYPWTLPLYPSKRSDNMMLHYDPNALGVDRYNAHDRIQELRSRMKQSMEAASDVAEKLKQQSGFRADALNFELFAFGDTDKVNRYDGHVVAPGHKDYGDRNGPRFIVPDMGRLQLENGRVLLGPIVPMDKLRDAPPYEYKGYNPDKDVLLVSFPESFTIFRTFKVVEVPHTDEKKLWDPNSDVWNNDEAKESGVLDRLKAGKCERYLEYVFNPRQTNPRINEKGEKIIYSGASATIYYTTPRKQALAIQHKAGKQLLEFHPLFKRALFAEKLYEMDDYLAFKDVHTTRELLEFISSKYKT